MNRGGRSDMPEVLEALDSVVELLNDVAGDGGDHRGLDNALTRHIEMLEEFERVQAESTLFKAQTRTEGEDLADAMEELFGKDSHVSGYAKNLAESVPDTSGENAQTIRLLDKQIGKLLGLRKKLRAEDATQEVLREQIEILRSLPEIFPKGAPVRESLERRIRSLTKED